MKCFLFIFRRVFPSTGYCKLICVSNVETLYFFYFILFWYTVAFTVFLCFFMLFVCNIFFFVIKKMWKAREKQAAKKKNSIWRLKYYVTPKKEIFFHLWNFLREENSFAKNIEKKKNNKMMKLFRYFFECESIDRWNCEKNV